MSHPRILATARWGSRHVSTTSGLCGGNDETNGNVQLVRRRVCWSVDGHLTEIHPEIGEAADKEQTEAR